MFKNDFAILDNNYRIVEMIGDGSYGEIYKVEKKGSKTMYAMKAERTQPDKKQMSLLWESKIINKLKKNGVQQIVNVHHLNQCKNHDGITFNILIMDLHGPSIAELFKQSKTLDLETVLNIGIQSIKVM